MPFPLSADGTVSAYGADASRAMAALRTMIEEEEVATLLASGDRIDFTSVDPYGFKSPLIGPLDSGTVTFQHEDGWTKAHYCVSFRRALTHVTVMTVLVFGIVPVLVMGWHPASVLFVLATCSCLFGANYVTAAVRFRAALHRALQASRPQATRGT